MQQEKITLSQLENFLIPPGLGNKSEVFRKWFMANTSQNASFELMTSAGLDGLNHAPQSFTRRTGKQSNPNFHFSQTENSLQSQTGEYKIGQ
jgi:hypothetical protein